MAGYIVVGTQWGDEGKGKVIDVLSDRADYIVRFQGGNNSGRTIVIDDEKFVLHMLPSGIIRESGRCILGAGVYVNLEVLIKELDILETRGIDTSHFFISDRAHIIMPYHIKLDELMEEARGKEMLGTLKKGIGPCASDKLLRQGIRFHDLFDKEILKEKLQSILKVKNNMIQNLYGGDTIDFNTIFNDLCSYAEKLSKRRLNAVVEINNALNDDKFVLFEGAQAMMLDINYGTYPYVTSSSPTSGGAMIGAGVAPNKIDRIIGVMKAYISREGTGPFVTELTVDERIQDNYPLDAANINEEDLIAGNTLQEIGGEYSTITGKARRCGWLDAVIAKHAIDINGLTDIVMTKLDVLSGFEEIKVCIGYDINGTIYNDIPSDTKVLLDATPVYKTFEGWTEDISNITNYNDLPENCKQYIEEVEEIIGCPITMISVGADRKQNIFVNSTL